MIPEGKNGVNSGDRSGRCADKSVYIRFNRVSWKIINPGPGVRLGASAGGVVSTIGRDHGNVSYGLYLTCGLEIARSRFCLIAQNIHCLSPGLKNVDIVSKSIFSFSLSML